jgi:ribosomal protein S19E (S16A)
MRTLTGRTIIACIAVCTIIVLSLPAFADRSDNDHMKSAELTNSTVIKGKVDRITDKTDYYRLTESIGDKPRFIISGSSYVTVFVYDDSKLIGSIRNSKKGKQFTIKGTCVLKVVAEKKSEDDDRGGGLYQITIKNK